MNSLHPAVSRGASSGGREAAAGRIEAIFTAPEGGAPMEQQGTVVVVPGVGIVGDRYALGSGTWSDPRWPDQELTLFEAEIAEALGIELYVPRRNVVLREVSLHGLIGIRFRLGEALLLGVRPCSPCRHIEELTGVEGLTKALARERGGLRVRILEGGRIRLGDTIEVVGLDEE